MPLNTIYYVLATVLSCYMLPYFIFINHLYKVGIILPTLQMFEPSSVRLGNLPIVLVSQVYLPQSALQSQEKHPA